ncbi:MAG: KEOPS complex kinase/ATPase Bud32 [Candidatus Nanoarchaeia archaeon]
MEKIIFAGAEALIRQAGEDELIKDRVKKKYRIKEIDEKLRRSRTKIEFNLMKKALQKGIFVPKVWDLEEFSFKMQYLKGKLVRDYLPDCLDKKKLFETIGKQINLMHESDIVHGDLTTSNMIIVDGNVYFIDFSLGALSNKLEDKAVDLHLIKQALIAKHNSSWKECFNSIINNYKNLHVLEKLKSVEKRGRKKA